jgi:hypothetical protein
LQFRVTAISANCQPRSGFGRRKAKPPAAGIAGVAEVNADPAGQTCR